jgi:hypothetical protein
MNEKHKLADALQHHIDQRAPMHDEGLLRLCVGALRTDGRHFARALLLLARVSAQRDSSGAPAVTFDLARDIDRFLEEVTK